MQREVVVKEKSGLRGGFLERRGMGYGSCFRLYGGRGH